MQKRGNLLIQEKHKTMHKKSELQEMQQTFFLSYNIEKFPHNYNFHGMYFACINVEIHLRQNKKSNSTNLKKNLTQNLFD